ncbi:hypothetical protein [Adhaeribacter aquaticus]|uniref:hypothetical protein n=1 Tax=Adhaeribacter aquaticus TaxID=299567 RepID=UPI000415AAB1|nr:hypothetical protein [Adhaeribacter aquaticus]
MKKFLIVPALFLAFISQAQNSANRNALLERKNGLYSIVLQNQVLEIDPEQGGRITALKLDGKNFLTSKDVHPAYWGSSFWPSPQSVWKNPAVLEVDQKPYTVSVENNVLKMTSPKDSNLGYVFTKQISGDARKGTYTIKYVISNESGKVQQVAPWEVTRVHPNGIAFYPKGTGERWGNMAGLAEDKDGITWFNYPADKITRSTTKFFSDGAEGWVAQLNGDILFVKKFPEIAATKAAPGEAEVEIYANPDKLYVEVENQGEYVELQPGASTAWEVTWYLRKLPPSIKPEAGNPALTAFVRNLIK